MALVFAGRGSLSGEAMHRKQRVVLLVAVFASVLGFALLVVILQILSSFD